MSNRKPTKLKVVSDYILIQPHRPKGGTFEVNDTFIDEYGIVIDCGPQTSKEIQSFKGKQVVFNAWACDQKTIQGQRYYFATESANAVCALI